MKFLALKEEQKANALPPPPVSSPTPMGLPVQSAARLPASKGKRVMSLSDYMNASTISEKPVTKQNTTSTTTTTTNNNNNNNTVPKSCGTPIQSLTPSPRFQPHRQKIASSTPFSPPPIDPSTQKQRKTKSSIDRLSTPKKKPADGLINGSKRGGDAIHIKHGMRESEDSGAIWGSAPAAVIPDNIQRRLSSVSSNVGGWDGGEGTTLADTLLQQQATNLENNVEVRPGWDSDFVDHKSLKLSNLGSVHEPERYVPRMDAKRKSASNMMLARGLMKKGNERPVEINNDADSNGFTDGGGGGGGGTKTKTLLEIMNEKNAAKESTPAPIAKPAPARTTPGVRSSGGGSLADFLTDSTSSNGGAPREGGKTLSDYAVASIPSDAEQQKALWDKFLPK